MINRKDCKHEHTVIIKTPELQHYGKEVCKDCGKFIKWVSEPNKLSVKEKCELIMPVLEKRANGSKSEFFQSIIKQWHQKGKLSPKQVECIVGNISRELLETYGEDTYIKLSDNS